MQERLVSLKLNRPLPLYKEETTKLQTCNAWIHWDKNPRVFFWKKCIFLKRRRHHILNLTNTSINKWSEVSSWFSRKQHNIMSCTQIITLKGASTPLLTFGPTIYRMHTSLTCAQNLTAHSLGHTSHKLSRSRVDCWLDDLCGVVSVSAHESTIGGKIL
jgi:hypothetical protein